MATYSYTCKEHGKFETRYSMLVDSSVSYCPKCGEMCVKVIEPANIHSFFEGSVKKELYLNHSGIG